MFTQLNPPLPLFIVSKNAPALAHGVIDYGPEHHLLWICFLNENGECWTVPNSDVRMEWNYSMARIPVSKQVTVKTAASIHGKKQSD